MAIEYIGVNNALRLNSVDYNQIVLNINTPQNLRTKLVLLGRACALLISMIRNYDLSPDQDWYRVNFRKVFLAELGTLLMVLLYR